MLTAGDLSSISDATKTRQALMDVRRRENEQFSGSARASGPRYKPQTESKQLPLYDRSGNLFAAPLLYKDQALTLPDDIENGSLVEYKDSATGDYYYGKVLKSETDKSKIEIEQVSKDAVESIKESNKETKIYELNQSNIVKQPGKSGFKALMSMLDLSETTVFKIFTLLLVGNMFKSESITDVFMAVYIRVIAIAVIMISVIYLSTAFFG